MNEESLLNEDKIDGLQIYEVGYHLLQSVGDSGLEKEVNNIKEVLSLHGSSQISESFPVLMSLSYSISKDTGSGRKSYDKAFFGSLKFELPKENIEKVKKSLEINPQILRFLIVKTVRENTLYYAKENRAMNDKIETEVEDSLLPKISSAEIDKSIEELVIE